MQRYEASTNAHDLDATLAMIADDAVYLFSDQSSHVGKAAIQKVLTANFRSIRNETYSIRDLRWLAVSETVAVCVYAFAWTGEIDGCVASGSGRGTSVLRGTGGNWLVVHEHLSRGPLF
jgi:ketosteroid isomerase-like protein